MSPKYLISSTILIGLLGCGSGGDDDFDGAVVTRVDISDDQIRVGEGSVLAVQFSFDSRSVFSDDGNVRVVVRLPAGVSYREGTSEIDGITKDKKIGAQVTQCPSTGESYLLYDMDQFDLDDASNPDGDGDARLTLTVDGVTAGEYLLEARGSENTPRYGCGDNFFSDEDAPLEVR